VVNHPNRSKKEKEVPMVVTTERGVFFGYGVPSMEAVNIKLSNARMVVYWGADCRSVVGLAANGPTNSCRIGPKAPSIIIRNLTAIIECSDEVALEFEAAPWSR
jgi:hypothetical protein